MPIRKSRNWEYVVAQSDLIRRKRHNMTITSRNKYALMAVFDLANAWTSGERALHLQQIAEHHHIPSGYLLQIMRPLCTAGIVYSARGSKGEPFALQPNSSGGGVGAELRLAVREPQKPAFNVVAARNAWCGRTVPASVPPVALYGGRQAAQTRLRMCSSCFSLMRPTATASITMRASPQRRAIFFCPRMKCCSKPNDTSSRLLTRSTAVRCL